MTSKIKYKTLLVYDNMFFSFDRKHLLHCLVNNNIIEGYAKVGNLTLVSLDCKQVSAIITILRYGLQVSASDPT